MTLQRWRHWRRTRPFYAGLLMLAGAAALVGISWVDLGLIRLTGRAGASSWTISALLTVAGLSTWTQPAHRNYAGTLAIAMALCSLFLANLGGLLIGFLLAAAGGCLALAWTVQEEAPAQYRHRPRG
ncbi:DUF6114 domain-containing protein [Streptomyces sp. NPDC052396]|uniref:DUF6114 domain-containing protein n=1 Tax=Streptomyces sp. NPDC052396 TaxID=3365689 RepID=UPI0037D45035